MVSKATLLAVFLVMVLSLITRQGGARRHLLPPVCQTWNSTTVVCRRQAISQFSSDFRSTLTRIPPGIPKSITTLDLSGNNITDLHKDSFNELRNLQYLVLSGIYLRTIEDGAFAQLENLKELQLCYPSNATNEDVFKGLSNLRYLHLDLNNVGCLSDHAFVSLTSLENLAIVEISGLEDRTRLFERLSLWSPLTELEFLSLSVHRDSEINFGPVFRYFSNLHTIEIKLLEPVSMNVTVRMLQPLSPHLQHLDLRLLKDEDSDISIDHGDLLIEHGVLESLTNLQTLHLPRVPFSSIADVLPELRHTQIEELLFYSHGIDAITSETLAVIDNLENLKILSLLTTRQAARV
ncbi:leucine-rich repeat and immunoglobulin-like domain containing-NOGO receptor-interacting protein 4 [Branchiostoma floridae]|uniref:Leucine-rich repeat and immunoglobulin-like domain containing-NOGO receptor-interacting protein 4 n=1 Tax=Branchiostoma floridae TaxID=7739 RepID=A0A9J7KK92_BRAFL|nr:leucine-rich repeat and immunoglobulin-like domain containing-NOGO receptor-interacting protein 4 [Branchiostoma floridae]